MQRRVAVDELRCLRSRCVRVVLAVHSGERKREVKSVVGGNNMYGMGTRELFMGIPYDCPEA